MVKSKVVKNGQLYPRLLRVKLFVNKYLANSVAHRHCQEKIKMDIIYKNVKMHCNVLGW